MAAHAPLVHTHTHTHSHALRARVITHSFMLNIGSAAPRPGLCEPKPCACLQKRNSTPRNCEATTMGCLCMHAKRAEQNQIAFAWRGVAEHAHNTRECATLHTYTRIHLCYTIYMLYAHTAHAHTNTAENLHGCPLTFT